MPVPGLRRQLVEQRARVERVAAGVCFEPLDRPRRQADALGLGERAQLLRGQRLQPQPAPLGPGGGLDEAFWEAGRVLARRRHHQHTVGDEPPDDEQQRAQRRHVGPVGVVEEQHDRVLVLQSAEQLEDPRARRQVIRLSGGGGSPARRRSWSTTPKGSSLSDRSPLARSTVTSRASARKCSTSDVLPMPAGPSTSTSQGRPARACSSPSSSASSSRSRPTKTGRVRGVSSCLCVAIPEAECTLPPPR